MNFADNTTKKTSAKPRIRPSIAGDMRGVDVQRVVASQPVAEDRQDIEDASTRSSIEPQGEEIDTLKKFGDMQLSEGKSGSQSNLEQVEPLNLDGSKSVNEFVFNFATLGINHEYVVPGSRKAVGDHNP